MNEKLTLEEIHSVTLCVLKKVIDICDKLNINYYMAYGTLIGVVRHNGFIPWDDDCDITMCRPDYEKFVSYCDSHAEELYPYKLLSKTNTNNYPYNIVRFNDMRYKAVYENTQSYDSGVFIDIYPLDGIDISDPALIKKINQKRKFLKTMIIWATDDHFEKSKHNKWYRTMIKYIARSWAKTMGGRYFLDKLENLKNTFDYDACSYVGDMVWDFSTVPLKKEWFDDYLFADFEGVKVKIPHDYDSFLKVYYGNYMELPPENQRVASHFYAIYRRDGL